MKRNNLSLCQKHRDISKKGFTLIELLIVIAIIGVLASIVLVNLNGAGGKANRAAFISEARSASAGIMVACLTDTLALGSGPLVNTSNIRFVAISSQSCGSRGNRTFCVQATNINEFETTGVGACPAYISQSGLFYNDNTCTTALTGLNCK